MISRTLGGPEDPPDRRREFLDFVICTDCEAQFRGSWSPAGQPLHEGGWRHVLTRRNGGIEESWAPCACPVGQLRAAGMSAGASVGEDYPPNAAIRDFLSLGISPREWKETREIREISETELEGWRKKHLRSSEEDIPDWQSEIGQDSDLW